MEYNRENDRANATTFESENRIGIDQDLVPPIARRSRLGYFTIFLLLIVFPVMSIATIQDPEAFLKELSLSPIWLVYLPTMLIQWIMFGIVYAATWREGTFLRGLGLKKLRVIDFFWAMAFVLVSNLILSLMAWLLAKVGLSIPGELELILPKTTEEKILWVFLSFTAGFCEETAFRGYLMTRIRLYGGLRNWVVPVVLSSLVFGSGHAYQGVGGLILITSYGAMFAILFFRTGTLWPVVIAHFFQDFGALFYPYQ